MSSPWVNFYNSLATSICQIFFMYSGTSKRTTKSANSLHYITYVFKFQNVKRLLKINILLKKGNELLKTQDLVLMEFLVILQVKVTLRMKKKNC